MNEVQDPTVGPPLKEESEPSPATPAPDTSPPEEEGNGDGEENND